MSNTLTINTTLVNDHWEITGSMSTGTLPAEIFIHTNTGTEVLGEYKGVCSINELSRLQVFSDTAIPTFGNRFVRTNTVKIIVTLETNTTSIVNTLVSSVNLLSVAYKSKINSVQVFTIV